LDNKHDFCIMSSCNFIRILHLKWCHPPPPYTVCTISWKVSVCKLKSSEAFRTFTQGIGLLFLTCYCPMKVDSISFIFFHTCHGTHCCVFRSGRGRWIFRGDKNPQHALSFGGEVKPPVPGRRFTACKRTLHSMSEMLCRQKFPNRVSHPWFSCSATRWLWLLNWYD
jgi:hypothetical protein